MKESLKVGVSGVRGIVGPSLSPQIVASFAQAFGTFVGHGPVVVGRDTRPTGLMLENAVVTGLQSVGCKPLLVGVAATPTILFLTRELGARGGICITASHNEVPWNALKFADASGVFLGEERANELFDIYHQQDFALANENALLQTVSVEKETKRHFERVVEYVDADLIRSKQFRVAMDCCNGVGALYSVHFLKEMLGCKVFSLFDTAHGSFERGPEPVPENLKALQQMVCHHQCAIGFGQDPDGDRLAIVNERGEPIGEDLTLALAVRQVLECHDRGPVAINMSTSKTVEEAAHMSGEETVRTKIGEINVVQKMLEIDAPIGGENNGGVIIPAIHPCRDSFSAMAIILELMARTQESVSSLRNTFPEYHVVRDKIEIRSDKISTMLRRVRKQYSLEKLNLLDGVHIDFEHAWVHVRPSNTEPVLRITAEAREREEAQKICNEIRTLIAKQL